jgi:hypothetical protein
MPILVIFTVIIIVIVAKPQNDFLATTASMIFIGSNMLFAGFFRTVDQTPPAINWLCYVFPMRWSFAGFATQIFAGRDWDVSGYNGVEVSGKDILDNFFDLRNVNTWGMFGALLGYVVFFRCGQYFLMAAQTGFINVPVPAFVVRLLHPEKEVEKPTSSGLASSSAAEGNYTVVAGDDSASASGVELTKVSPSDKA